MPASSNAPAAETHKGPPAATATPILGPHEGSPPHPSQVSQPPSPPFPPSSFTGRPITPIHGVGTPPTSPLPRAASTPPPLAVPTHDGSSSVDLHSTNHGTGEGVRPPHDSTTSTQVKQPTTTVSSSGERAQRHAEAHPQLYSHQHGARRAGRVPLATPPARPHVRVQVPPPLAHDTLDSFSPPGSVAAAVATSSTPRPPSAVPALASPQTVGRGLIGEKGPHDFAIDPILRHGVVVIGDIRGDIICLDQRNGRTLWEQRTGAPMLRFRDSTSTQPLLVPSLSPDNTLFTLFLDTPSPKLVKAPIQMTELLLGREGLELRGYLFRASKRSRLIEIELHTGRVLYDSETGQCDVDPQHRSEEGPILQVVRYDVAMDARNTSTRHSWNYSLGGFSFSLNNNAEGERFQDVPHETEMPSSQRGKAKTISVDGVVAFSDGTVVGVASDGQRVWETRLQSAPIYAQAIDENGLTSVPIAKRFESPPNSQPTSPVIDVEMGSKLATEHAHEPLTGTRSGSNDLIVGRFDGLLYVQCLDPQLPPEETVFALPAAAAAVLDRVASSPDLRGGRGQRVLPLTKPEPTSDGGSNMLALTLPAHYSDGLDSVDMDLHAARYQALHAIVEESQCVFQRTGLRIPRGSPVAPHLQSPPWRSASNRHRPQFPQLPSGQPLLLITDRPDSRATDTNGSGNGDVPNIIGPEEPVHSNYPTPWVIFNLILMVLVFVCLLGCFRIKSRKAEIERDQAQRKIAELEGELGAMRALAEQRETETKKKGPDPGISGHSTSSSSGAEPFAEGEGHSEGARHSSPHTRRSRADKYYVASTGTDTEEDDDKEDEESEESEEESEDEGQSEVSFETRLLAPKQAVKSPPKPVEDPAVSISPRGFDLNSGSGIRSRQNSGAGALRNRSESTGSGRGVREAGSASPELNKQRGGASPRLGPRPVGSPLHRPLGVAEPTADRRSERGHTTGESGTSQGGDQTTASETESESEETSTDATSDGEPPVVRKVSSREYNTAKVPAKKQGGGKMMQAHRRGFSRESTESEPDMNEWRGGLWLDSSSGSTRRSPATEPAKFAKAKDGKNVPARRRAGGAAKSGAAGRRSKSVQGGAKSKLKSKQTANTSPSSDGGDDSSSGRKARELPRDSERWHSNLWVTPGGTTSESDLSGSTAVTAVSRLPHPTSSRREKTVSILKLQFDIIRTLGQGGYGRVFEVKNKFDGNVYALKQIKLRGLDDTRYREHHLLAKMEHKNVVRYYWSWIEQQEEVVEERDDSLFKNAMMLGNSSATGAGFTTDPISPTSPTGGTSVRAGGTTHYLYILMEACQSTLEKEFKEAREKGHAPDPRKNLERLRHIASGLQYLHSDRKILHRDLKPSNIFIRNTKQGGVLKIGDFGLSRFGDESEANAVASSPSDTGGEGWSIYKDMTGDIGTSMYSAPEQLGAPQKRKGKVVPKTSYSPSVDIYSLGVIFFESYLNVKSAMERHQLLTGLRDRLEIPAELSLKYPREMELVLQMVSRDPDRRPPLNQILTNAREIKESVPRHTPRGSAPTSPGSRPLVPHQSEVELRRLQPLGLPSVNTVPILHSWSMSAPTSSGIPSGGSGVLSSSYPTRVGHQRAHTEHMPPTRGVIPSPPTTEDEQFGAQSSLDAGSLDSMATLHNFPVLVAAPHQVHALALANVHRHHHSSYHQPQSPLGPPMHSSAPSLPIPVPLALMREEGLSGSQARSSPVVMPQPDTDDDAPNSSVLVASRSNESGNGFITMASPVGVPAVNTMNSGSSSASAGVLATLQALSNPQSGDRGFDAPPPASPLNPAWNTSGASFSTNYGRHSASRCSLVSFTSRSSSATIDEEDGGASPVVSGSPSVVLSPSASATAHTCGAAAAVEAFEAAEALAAEIRAASELPLSRSGSANEAEVSSSRGVPASGDDSGAQTFAAA